MDGNCKLAEKVKASKCALRAFWVGGCLRDMEPPSKSPEPIPEADEDLDEEAQKIFDAFEPKPPKYKWYITNLLAVAWEELSVTDLIAEAIAGFLVPIAANKFNFSETSELPELFFLCVGAAIFVPLFAFVLRLIFRAPYDIYKRQKRVINHQNEQIEWLEKERDKANEVKPFLVEAMPRGAICFIKLSNPNPIAYQIHFKLLTIEPTLYMRPNGFSTDMLCLAGGHFVLRESSFDDLEPRGVGTLELFSFRKTNVQDEKPMLHLGGFWEGKHKYSFRAEGEYVFTFSIAANNMDTAKYSYRVNFDASGDGSFTIEAIK